MKPELALLIDGDQVSPAEVEAELRRLEEDWSVTERVCVRNWRSSKDLKAWQEFATEAGIRLFQRDPVATGKNAADIEVAILAMDLFHGMGYRAFCLVSGDTDFVPLVQRLRRAACTVDWAQPVRGGRKRAPAKKAEPKAAKPRPAAKTVAAKTTAKAPTKTAPKATTKPAPKAAPKTAAKPRAKGLTDDQRAFARHVRRAVGDLRGRGEHNGGWVSVNRVGTLLGEAGHKREEFGFAKSRQLRLVLEDLGFKTEQVETGAYRVTMD